MKITLDMHTHTIVSGHAFSSLREMARMAKLHGLETLGVTDHAPKMPFSCGYYYFQNLKVVPKEMEGVRLLMGAEVNIMDDAGSLDLTDEIMDGLDIAIASLHLPCFGEGHEIVYNTKGCIEAMKHPRVQILGHPDDSRFPVDYKELVQAAKAYKVLLEINNSSLRQDSFRPGARENDRQMLAFCREYGVPVILGSDSHIDETVGVFDLALSLLEEVDFPEELVVKNYEELEPYLSAL